MADKQRKARSIPIDAGRGESEGLLRVEDISKEQKFDAKNWPVDPLTSLLKSKVVEEVKAFMPKAQTALDPQDLKYQVLFRLTTYSPAELFVKGEEIEAHLAEKGAYDDWRKIPQIDARFISGFAIRDELVRDVVKEQYGIIAERLKHSELRLGNILTPVTPASQEGWRIHRKSNSFTMVPPAELRPSPASIRLELREAELDYANAIFNDLHYIHTPRAKLAMALFMPGDADPISVLGMAPIDRGYKQQVLEMHGYEPWRCWELVRLYSRPGVPMNTSSIMLSQGVKKIKELHKELQACLSAFTPSFANGRSMIAGGFDNPILAKPLKMVFGRADDAEGWERLTSRRLAGYTGPTISSKIPLLPTLELMRRIRGPTRESVVSGHEMLALKRQEEKALA